MIVLVKQKQTTGSDTLLGLTDTPSVYDDGKYLKSTIAGAEWTTVIAYPKYYITSGLRIILGNWEQYVIHETGYIEIAGALELGEGCQLIIQ